MKTNGLNEDYILAFCDLFWIKQKSELRVTMSLFCYGRIMIDWLQAIVEKERGSMDIRD